MIPIEDAEKILGQVPVKPKPGKVPLTDCLGRVMAVDIISKINMPPFDKSAMDGFAVSSGDDSPRYEIVETVAAGEVPQKEIETGQCARIMTGAMLPRGSDRVIKKEIVAEEDGFMRVLEDDPAQNVCHKGEDVKVGDRVLGAGTLIRPQECAILASMGLDSVPVFERPRVGILTTGSEIVEPGGKLAAGQIFNSNAYSLAAQVERCGGLARYGGRVSDSPGAIREKIDRLIEENDMLLISGGVSMGDFDFVPQILTDLGVKLYFEKVAVKPGKPTVFGSRGDKVVFGLPGNPVSTFVIFEIFVRAFLGRMMGYDYRPLQVTGVLDRDFSRKKNARTAFIPVYYHDGKVEIPEYHGSAHIYALSRANGLFKIAAGQKQVAKGSEVHVRLV